MLRLILIAALAGTGLSACVSPFAYESTVSDREYWDREAQAIRSRYSGN